MSRDCYAKNIPGMLKKLEKQTLKPHKKTAYNYVKRSLELMGEGWPGTIVFDKAGNIAGAAAYDTFKGRVRVETLGSIGGMSDDGVTPGMQLLYNIYTQNKKKDITLYSTPTAVEFYERYGFKGQKGDGRSMDAKPADFMNYVNWFDANRRKYDE